MILAAQHLRDAALGVIEHIAEEERCAAVGSADDEITDIGALEALLPVHEVGELDATVVRHPEAQRGLAARGKARLTLSGVEGATGAGIAWRSTRGELCASARLDLERRTEAGVDETVALELAERQGIGRPAGRLQDDRLVPQEAEPAQILVDACDELGSAALAVGVLDAQQEPATAAPGEQPVEERGARIAEMQLAARARCEPGGVGGDGVGADLWKRHGHAVQRGTGRKITIQSPA